MALEIRHREPVTSLATLDSLHPVLRRVLERRNLSSADDLSLRPAGLLPPRALLGMEAAVDLLLEARRLQQRILVVSDFDADGATSCALMLSALAALGFRQLDYLVPNRFTFGYGLTPAIVTLARTRNPDLIITVDNGISSLDGVAAAQAAGIRVLVTDHHLPGSQLPGADAIVNPNQPGCPFPSKSLAGVGVAFYLMLALRARLRDQGSFGTDTPEPNLAELLDLVALGTVADVVPLDVNNRILVQEGLRRIRAGRARPGIQALLEVAGRTPADAIAADLGYAAGPRLNAAGRLDDMSLGIECLLTTDPGQAAAQARQLDALNRDRRQIESEMRYQAFAALDQLRLNDTEMPAGLCLYDPSWHQGVVGILASRVKDRFHRPVIAFADATETGSDGVELKGSARSVAGYHIRDALDTVAARHPGLISRFGGHAMAAGLSLPRAHLEAFQRHFAEHAAAALDDASRQAVWLTDGELDAAEFDVSTAELLRSAMPWGQGFPEPSFDGVFAVMERRIVGERHLKLKLRPAGADTLVDAIAFNAELDATVMQARDLQLVYRLDVNLFRGQRSLQLMVDALAPV